MCDDGFESIKTMVACVLEDDDDLWSGYIEQIYSYLFVFIMLVSLALLFCCVCDCTKEKATKQTNPEDVAKKPIAPSTPALAADSVPKLSN